MMCLIYTTSMQFPYEKKNINPFIYAKIAKLNDFLMPSMFETLIDIKTILEMHELICSEF